MLQSNWGYDRRLNDSLGKKTPSVWTLLFTLLKPIPNLHTTSYTKETAYSTEVAHIFFT